MVLLDRATSARERRIETFLIFLFALGVAGGGISNFFAHLFLSDLVAQSIGWPAGSPFQLEIAFANLAIGVLGLIAVGRRDGFREATVIAVTVFSGGATIVHIMDIVATGNLAPGNTLQNVLNVVKPALLIWLLLQARKLESEPGSEAKSSQFQQWRGALMEAAGIATACVATAFGVGFALSLPVLITLLGSLVSIAAIITILNRSPWHQIRISSS